MPVCNLCGKEVQSDWLLCPYCQNKLKAHSCTACAFPLEKDWLACPMCGKLVLQEGTAFDKRFCPHCKNEVAKEWKVCPICATPLAQSEQLQSTPQKNVPESQQENQEVSDEEYDNYKKRKQEMEALHDELIERARIAIIRSDYKTAKQIYTSILDHFPNNVQALIGTIRIASENYTLMDDVDVDEAIRIAKEICPDVDFSACDADYAKYEAERNAYFEKKAEQKRNALHFNPLKNILLSYTGSENELDLPEGFSTIGGRAFFQNQHIEFLTLPQGITTIGKEAFAYSSLHQIFIPKTVKCIDNGAFDACNELHSIHYEGTKKDWNDLISNSMSCSSGTDYAIFRDKTYEDEPFRHLEKVTLYCDGDGFVSELNRSGSTIT